MSGKAITLNREKNEESSPNIASFQKIKLIKTKKNRENLIIPHV